MFRNETNSLYFSIDLNVSADTGLRENLIQFNPSKSKSIKIPIFNRANKDVWLEKRTAIGNLKIISAAIPIEIKNIQVNGKTFKEYQKGNSNIQNCNNENKFLPSVDLSNLPYDQRLK